MFYLCDHGVSESYDEGFGVSFSWDVHLTQGYDHEFLRPGFKPKKFGFLEMDAPNLDDRLNAFRPDLVWLHGYGQRMCWRALNWAKKNHSSVVYFGDSELLHDRKIVSKVIKKMVLPRFFAQCDAFITIGERNEEYYRYYGVGDDKLYKAACPVDMSRFRIEPEARESFNDEVRKQYGIHSDHLVIIFSGKLQDYKRPGDLVRAMKQIARKDVHVLYIGDGPLRSALVSEASALGVSDQIHFSGFINQADMPKYMAVGDILALTSEKEPFGLVVTESLPFGMPIIVSDRVGCVGLSSAARPNVNALVYPVGDISKLSEMIMRVVESVDLRRELGSASIEIAPSQDISVTVDAIMRIAASV